MTKQHYVPNLAELQLLGELNYRRIGKVLRTKEEEREWHFAIDTSGHQRSCLSLYLKQESRFTSEFVLAFMPETKSDLMFDAKLKMIIRLYHDVGLAEITDGHRQFKGSYPYPNDEMHHKDEKFRLNQQLADLLELCLKHGHRLDDVPFIQMA
ncbi:DUF1249 domain-containing protein [Marinomonas balearica]|uniref:DUF1249 domain-containing protein n=1 Tax=Marinomonas balearica TaxID=491947 RepID=A0A4R6M6P2_9GAMM|nr:DUF1249 domain-containing protein [Marinomonas balearica]TDO96260.1 hypothetical protein DFP79_2832 [Marinomonas balearica]